MNSNEIESPEIRRRDFIFRVLKTGGLILSSQVVVYAVGSAFKDLDGSMVAGAKCAGACAGPPRWECLDGFGCFSPPVAPQCAAHGGPSGQSYNCILGIWVPN